VALWRARAKFGQDFMDGLLFYAYKNFDQPWRKDANGDFDTFFINRLDVIDMSASEPIHKILKDNGINLSKNSALPASSEGKQ
jgi:hypothetical protein